MLPTLPVRAICQHRKPQQACGGRGAKAKAGCQRSWPAAPRLVNLHGCAASTVALAPRRRSLHANEAPWSQERWRHEVEPRLRAHAASAFAGAPCDGATAPNAQLLRLKLLVSRTLCSAHVSSGPLDKRAESLKQGASEVVQACVEHVEDQGRMGQARLHFLERHRKETVGSLGVPIRPCCLEEDAHVVRQA